jgi:Sulfotransferase family
MSPNLSELSGPDFLCAGMPRAGTGWLFDQLSHHPDFWMPPIKELHYFDNEFPKQIWTKMIEMSRANPDRMNKNRQKRRVRPLTDRDQAFFEDVMACRTKDIDFELYARLFRHKNGLLSGDVTPGYCDLEEKMIARIAKAFPKLKIILLIRDPVSRAWSRILMRYRRNEFDPKKLEEVDKFKKLLDSGGSSAGGSQTEIFARWNRHLPESQVRYFFLDDTATDPQGQRREILTYLGADPEKQSGDVEADFNRKSKFEKVEMADAIREFLVHHFENEMRESVRVFGPKAETWLKSYDLPATHAPAA